MFCWWRNRKGIKSCIVQLFIYKWYGTEQIVICWLRREKWKMWQEFCMPSRIDLNLFYNPNWYYSVNLVETFFFLTMFSRRNTSINISDFFLFIFSSQTHVSSSLVWKKEWKPSNAHKHCIDTYIKMKWKKKWQQHILLVALFLSVDLLHASISNVIYIMGIWLWYL